MNAIFGHYSEYYDLLYEDKDYKLEAEFVNKCLMSNSMPANGRILELGCGSGLHAISLNSLGYKVHGVDLSPEMVAKAHYNAAKSSSTSLSFECSDIRYLRTNERFDAAISLFHVFSYQTTNEDIIATLNSAARSLRNGGLLFFDCWYGPAVLSDPPVKRVKTISNESIEVVRESTPELLINSNLVNVKFDVSITELSTRTTRKIEEVHSMRYYFLPEIDYFLNVSGFDLVDSFEWMTSDRLGVDTWYATVVARRTS